MEQEIREALVREKESQGIERVEALRPIASNSIEWLTWCLSQMAELRKENERLKESKPQPKIKIGDMVYDRKTGVFGEISDIQYEHNRYQFGNFSGWQYGIENLIKP